MHPYWSQPVVLKNCPTLLCVGGALFWSEQYYNDVPDVGIQIWISCYMKTASMSGLIEGLYEIDNIMINVGLMFEMFLSLYSFIENVSRYFVSGKLDCS